MEEEASCLSTDGERLPLEQGRQEKNHQHTVQWASDEDKDPASLPSLATSKSTKVVADQASVWR